jgi:acetyl/propionyl-CoA carboxylase alpha subunit
MITGIDLVEEQIKVARGEKLSFTQDELTIKGHAVELRVYAEDPLNLFFTICRYTFNLS